MYCSQCGTQVSDASTFCHSCGAAIAKAGLQHASAAAQPRPGGARAFPS
jgi:predicted amidophosphoribosyltransferase